MKLRILALVGLAFAVARLTSELPSAKAQSGCSNQTLAGPCTYALSGTYFTAQGEYEFSAAGRLVMDAKAISPA